MPQDKDNSTKRGDTRPEYEVAYYTKELGRSLQRKLLRERFAAFVDSKPPPAHGEDLRPETAEPPPEGERAG